VFATDHAASRFHGRARLKGAEWTPPAESPDDSYPMQLTTGRNVYHFHTCTKTGRAPELNAAAPKPWVELAPSDAAGLDIQDGDLVRVESRRGAVEVTARCNRDPAGHAVPALPLRRRRHRSQRPDSTSWDPVSKQPDFKSGAARIIPVEDD
jgi:ferredoxin-nitrate reductase